MRLYLHNLGSSVSMRWCITDSLHRTHRVIRDQDQFTGRKLINHYEIVEEIGRGQHGKVKLARDIENQGKKVAIKIIQRFSKKRRLGKLTHDPETKTKREVAILKKVRHPNIVGLLEVIDDPELKKIYLVLEHVELGEIQWRSKGDPDICQFERRRLEREALKIADNGDEEAWFNSPEIRRKRKERHLTKLGSRQPQVLARAEHWNMEHGDDDFNGHSLTRQTTRGSQHSLSYKSGPKSGPSSRIQSRAASRAPSGANSRSHTPLPEYDIPSLDSDNEDDEPAPHQSSYNGSINGSASGFDAASGYYGSYPDLSHPDDPRYFRGRSPSMTPSMADSIASHMVSDPFEEDYSYVPCFTYDDARVAFRETVLGLEYLHYEGIVHRDIKPANLLWTKDHRVKISDFGVSYFGRPIREGETEENVSEADAEDFDDDKELAKTVGTPAYFAPELCYTNADVEQPKVTEQIDVWSLGVTLYGLIYARLPFLADDQYDLWARIANDEVQISRRRLKAVGPPIPPGNTTDNRSTWRYRNAYDLVYEEVDDELHDLLRRMLIKDPQDRIKLREVKRHPWVIKDIADKIAWIDDTDPSRQAAGQRIQVDKAELEHAVIPLSLIERARSAMKKTTETVLNLVKTNSKSKLEGSRRRAVSSATSSGTDNLHSPYSPSTPIMAGIREPRRASLRGDEQHFQSMSDLHEPERPSEHPLSQSVTASPDPTPNKIDPFTREASFDYPLVAIPSRVPSGMKIDTRPGPPERTISSATSIQTVVLRGHSRSRSVTQGQDVIPEEGYFTDHLGKSFGARSVRSLSLEDASATRSPSSDRGLFELPNKHSEPSIAMSNATAPGHILSAPTPDLFAGNHISSPSPMPFAPGHLQQQQLSHKSSSSGYFASDDTDLRPTTATRVVDQQAKTPPPRVYKPSTPESFERAQEVLARRDLINGKSIDQEKKAQGVHDSPCPPSPDDVTFLLDQQEPPKRARSSSSLNDTGAISQITSPSSSLNKGSQEQIFPSVPSLPALISSRSSVCADSEGDFLQQPGIVSRPTSESTSHDTHVLPKSSPKETPTPSVGNPYQSALSMNDDGYHGDRDTMDMDDDDSDSSDEGLVMAPRKPKPPVAAAAPVTLAMPRRRDTNASIGSTGTAKKVVMDL